MPVYGDQQSQYTLERSAFGETTAGLMQGASNLGGGASMGMHNMFSDVGQYIMPVGYHPSARSAGGNYGMYAMETSFSSGMGVMSGWSAVPKSLSAQEQIIIQAGGLGQRVGAGIGGGAAMVGGIAAGTIAGSAISSMVGGGFAGLALGGIAAPMAGAAVAEEVIKAVGQRQEIQSFLQSSSSRFVGAGSGMADPRTGSGMSIGARQETTQMIRSMDIADPRMDTGELTQILQSGTQMGLFSGSGNDIESFKKSFKEVTNQVKNITKVLHQTLQEGMETIKMLKDSGVGMGDITSTVNMADVTGKVAGRTASEMLGIGAQGAAMFRGTGIDMGVGFQANMMNSASIRAARDAGSLSAEAIRQAGGEEALTNRMTASGLSFAQSSTGRGMTAAFFSPSTGGFNEGTFGSAMMGGQGMVSLAQQAAGNMSNPANLIAFQANQHKIISDMANQFGGQGLQIAETGNLAAQAGFLRQNIPGLSGKYAFSYTALQQGKSQAEIDTMLAQMSGAGAIYNANQAATSASARRLVIEESSRNSLINRATKGMSDFGKGILDDVAAPISRGIDSASESFTNLALEMRGVQIADVGANTGLFLADSGAEFGPSRQISVDQGGFLTGRSIGSEIMDRIASGKYKSLGLSSGAVGGSSSDVLLKGKGGISAEQAQAIVQDAKNLTISDKEISAMRKKDDSIDNMANSLRGKLAGVDLNKVESVDDLLVTMYGEGATTGMFGGAEGKKRLAATKVALGNRGKRGQAMIAMIDKRRDAGIALGEAMNVQKINGAGLNIDDVREELDEALFGQGAAGFNPFGEQLSSRGFELISAAQAAEDRGDMGQAQKLREQALRAQNVDEADEQEFYDLLSNNKDVREAARKGGAAFSAKATQVLAVARNKLADRAEGDLSGADGLVDKSGIIANLRSGGIAALTKTQVATLGSSKNIDAQALASRATTLNDVGDRLKSAKTDSERRSILKGQGIGEDIIPGMLKDLKTASSDEFKGVIAKHQEVASLGGGVTAGVTGSGSTESGQADDLIRTQTRINNETLAIMQSLATRLGVH